MAIAVSFRGLAFALSMFLFLLDIMILPAPLPAETQKDDFLGKLPLLASMWSLPVSIRTGLAFATAIGSLKPWSALVGKQWASGQPCPNIPGSQSWHAMGCVLVLAGWGLRLWSKLTLADFFTYQISLPTDLITDGPYRYWAHPSYAGAIGHVMGTVMLLLVTMKRRVPIGMALFAILCAILIVRVIDEEKMLLQHFGEKWEAHVLSRCRLFPYIW
jgi:hypothetical protein